MTKLNDYNGYSMPCPNLSHLPSPPSGKIGWPWIKGSPQLAETLPNGSSWPKMTVVTPSYNQAEFIEETIRSVLLQGYPNLEYIIIDGGSTDGSVEIIKKYESWLTYWVSEPDNGQSDAINKGWQLSSGEFVTWLNSDDILTSSALFKAVEVMVKNPTVGLVYGDATEIDRFGKALGVHYSRKVGCRALIEFGKYLPANTPQPSTLIRKNILDQVGFLNVNLHYAMDYDLFCRIARQSPIVYIPHTQAKMRLYLGTKSSTNVLQNMQEKVSVLKKYHKYWFLSQYWFLYLRYLIWHKLPTPIQYYYRVVRKLPRDKIYFETKME